MKPIHLNLASRPYRDYRPVYGAVVVLSLLTAFLMLNNVETYYRYIHETRATRAKTAQVEGLVRTERQKEEIAKQRVKGLDVARLGQQTSFINAKLAERAFSWSRLLDELESVLADDVRLISVSPTFQPDGTIALALSFEARSGDGMITTINRMNADPAFADAFPDSETAVDSGIYQFGMTARYRPDARRAAEVLR